jgi:histidyl-tRNA synthetase
MPAAETPSSSSMTMIQRPKGTQDVLPSESHRWQHLEATTRQFFAQAGYQELRTPVLEHTELFQRGVGETTDIVSKEMFTFEKGERSLTLRPEGTAGVVRAFIEQGMSRLPKPVKVFYNGPMFRYERPQEGRQRQFHQIGVECFGLDTPAADAESILLAWGLFDRLGIAGDLSLEVNNVGDPSSREAFREGLRSVVRPHLADLCEPCQMRFETNPLRMLDCKAPACQAVYEGEAVVGFLETFEHPEAIARPFEETLDILRAVGVPFRVNRRLVRGLDYYTRTVFEISTHRLGAQNAVCGGGRYNHLVEQLGGPQSPAVGWALGVERILRLLPEISLPTLDAYVVTDRPADGFRLAQHLRAQGFAVEVDLSGRAFGKQLGQASKRQARVALIRGEAEAAHGQWLVKDLSGGQQLSVEEATVAAHLEILKTQAP